MVKPEIDLRGGGGGMNPTDRIADCLIVRVALVCAALMLASVVLAGLFV